MSGFFHFFIFSIPIHFLQTNMQKFKANNTFMMTELTELIKDEEKDKEYVPKTYTGVCPHSLYVDFCLSTIVAILFMFALDLKSHILPTVAKYTNNPKYDSPFFYETVVTATVVLSFLIALTKKRDYQKYELHIFKHGIVLNDRTTGYIKFALRRKYGPYFVVQKPNKGQLFGSHEVGEIIVVRSDMELGLGNYDNANEVLEQINKALNVEPEKNLVH